MGEKDIEAGARWSYSNEISLGQIMQALTLVAMIGGGALTSYISLRSDIQAASERASNAIALMNARIAVLEARHETDDRFQIETRRDLTRLLDALSDLRVQIGAKQDRQGNRLGLLPGGSAGIASPDQPGRP